VSAPSPLSAIASCDATVDFPTPPFPLSTSTYAGPGRRIMSAGWVSWGAVRWEYSAVGGIRWPRKRERMAEAYRERGWVGVGFWHFVLDAAHSRPDGFGVGILGRAFSRGAGLLVWTTFTARGLAGLLRRSPRARCGRIVRHIAHSRRGPGIRTLVTPHIFAPTGGQILVFRIGTAS
jgi:hypothetical protein